jgi:hypothetical protein
MFYAFHRAVKFALFCALLFVGWKIYQHRHVFDPALVWYDVWDNGGFRAQPLPTLSGEVDKVLSSQSFRLRATNIFFNVRLAGLQDPSKDQSVAAMEHERTRTKALAELIERKTIRLELSYENFNNVAGFAFIGATNINAELVRRRLAFTSKELLKDLPKEIQYQMLWSKSHRDPNN